MELLYFSLTKDSSLLLHATHSLSTADFQRKPDSTLVLKIHTKITQTRKLEPEKTRVYAQKLLL
jgi:hypothetical protein